MHTIKALLFAFTMLALNANCQQTKKLNNGGLNMEVSIIDSTQNKVFYEVGTMPEFPGGSSNLVAFAYRKLYYPKSAINDSIHGSVILEFVVDIKGSVIEKKIFQSIRVDLDSVCLNMLNQMPRWKPGFIGDKLVSVHFRWTITFVID